MDITDADDAETMAEKRRKYDRKWRERNQSKVKAIEDRFWAKHATSGEDAKAARCRYLREWRAANKEKVRAINLRYQANLAARKKSDSEKAK